MKAAGIAGVSRRKAARTTFRDERVRPACDPVDRNFHADEPNRLWVADITPAFVLCSGGLDRAWSGVWYRRHLSRVRL
jgi:hypothetical protein